MMTNNLRMAVVALVGTVIVSCKTTEETSSYTDPYYGGGAQGYGTGDYVDVTPTGQQGAGYGATQPYADSQQPAYQQPAYQEPAPAYQQPAYQEPAPATTGGGGTYTVQKGDTLYGISRKKGITVQALTSANGLSDDKIFPGDVLKIP
ncbi:hypothetical protein BH23VER1_BH23VER1_21480 [soil metagenome]